MEFLKKIVVFVLTLEAKLVLAHYKPKIIAITGSVGKTTTKDAVYTVLAEHLYVRRSEKSFNSELGVPLTILGLENAWKNPLRWIWNIMRGALLLLGRASYPEWLVLEVGADRPGDIRRVAQWLKPDVVVITGVSEIPVHVEYFSSPEEVAQEKRTLAEHMKADGTLILNGDDTRMAQMCAEYQERAITYGMGKQNNFHASHFVVSYEKKKPAGIRFRVNHEDAALPLSLRDTLGKARAYAALAACVVAHRAGVPGSSVAEQLGRWEPTPGRMRIIPGIHGSTIIDDTYNSSPAAVLNALDTLKDLKKSSDQSRKIVVLGDMLELGKYAADAHRSVGARVASFNFDMLITVGFRSRATGEAALDAGMHDMQVREYEQNESRRAGHELAREIKEGDIVLVKGSQSLRMERTVEELMEESERAFELLVRQEPEWLLKE